MPDPTDPLISPGACLLRRLRGLNMTLGDLAARTGLPVGYLRILAAGEAVLYPDVAVQLERVVGQSEQDWLALEHSFRAALTRRVNDVAGEILARGISLEIAAQRSDLPAHYLGKVFAGTAYFAPWVVDRIERTVARTEAEFAEAATKWTKAVEGLEVRVLFRDHWTETDWENDRRYQRRVALAEDLRKTVLLERGWKLYGKRSYGKGGCGYRSWAIDPLTGDEVLQGIAYAIQERREPDSITPNPERDYPRPPSSQPLFTVCRGDT